MVKTQLTTQNDSTWYKRCLKAKMVQNGKTAADMPTWLKMAKTRLTSKKGSK